MRTVTILFSLLDIVAALIIAAVIYKYSDPAFLGLDVFVGLAVVVLCLVTAVPALILAYRRRGPGTALILMLAFPIGFTAVVAGVFLYFTYYL